EAEQACDRSIAQGLLSPSIFLTRGRTRLQDAISRWSSAARFDDAARDLERAARKGGVEGAEAQHWRAFALLPLARQDEGLAAVEAAIKGGCAHPDFCRDLGERFILTQPPEPIAIAGEDLLRVEAIELG